jgi:hypothetical protein
MKMLRNADTEFCHAPLLSIYNELIERNKGLSNRQPFLIKMAARPTVSVFSAQGESSGSLPLPAVFTAPIRLDVVQQVHSEWF